MIDRLHLIARSPRNELDHDWTTPGKGRVGFPDGQAGDRCRVHTFNQNKDRKSC